MKKLLFGFVAVVAFGLNVNAKEVVSAEKLVEKETLVSTKSEGDDLLKISIHIEWGRVSRNCDGFGLCKTDIDIEFQFNDFFANVTKAGNLNLEVTKSGLESITKKFGGNTIIIEEDYLIPSDVCKQIGLREGYTVKAGKYTVVKNALGVNNVVL